MQYRKFGKLDWQVSALSLGTASLPALKEDEAVEVIHTAIDSGIRLIDVGRPLADKDNEAFAATLNKALADGYEGAAAIAATIPADQINTAADFERALEKLLKWLDAGTIKFLTLGGLDRFSWPRLQSLDVLKSAEKALADHRAGYLGFFFHDQYQFLRDIVRAYDNWTFCKFQYSLMDIDHHPGYGGLKYAADNGLAVIAAKPLLGGRLVNNIPEKAAKVWAGAKPERSAAEWALRWAWNHPEISTLVCDMDSAAQVKENAALADTALPDGLSVAEELVIGKARDAYLSLKPIPCTACRGCMPSGGNCVNGIDVPRVFEIYNDAVMYGDVDTARLICHAENHRPGACTECGTCVCGKNIPIPEWLKKAQELLAVSG